MAILSKGYTGSITDADWPYVSRWTGGLLYTVNGANDFKVTTASGDRRVQVAVGNAGGAGIWDTSNAIEYVTLPTVSSGSRWDLIGLRRDWSGSGATTVVRIAGSASKALPTRPVNPGTEDVQPLALVRVTAGSTAIQEIVDLRVWIADGGAYANDDLVRQYISRVGTMLTVGTITWVRRIGSTGTPVWYQAFEEPARASGVVAPISLQPGTANEKTVVKFPVGRFSVAPNVQVTQLGGARDTSVYIMSVAADGFVLGRGSTSIVARSGIGASWRAEAN